MDPGRHDDRSPARQHSPAVRPGAGLRRAALLHRQPQRGQRRVDRLPAGSTHVFCYYFTVSPAPDAATIVVKKTLKGATGSRRVPVPGQRLVQPRSRTGQTPNLNPFTVNSGSSIVFVRAAGRVDWNFFEEPDAVVSAEGRHVRRRAKGTGRRSSTPVPGHQARRTPCGSCPSPRVDTGHVRPSSTPTGAATGQRPDRCRQGDQPTAWAPSGSRLTIRACRPGRGRSRPVAAH